MEEEYNYTGFDIPAEMTNGTSDTINTRDFVGATPSGNVYDNRGNQYELEVDLPEVLITGHLPLFSLLSHEIGNGVNYWYNHPLLFYDTAKDVAKTSLDGAAMITGNPWLISAVGATNMFGPNGYLKTVDLYNREGLSENTIMSGVGDIVNGTMMSDPVFKYAPLIYGYLNREPYIDLTNNIDYSYLDTEPLMTYNRPYRRMYSTSIKGASDGNNGLSRELIIDIVRKKELAGDFPNAMHKYNYLNKTLDRNGHKPYDELKLIHWTGRNPDEIEFLMDKFYKQKLREFSGYAQEGVNDMNIRITRPTSFGNRVIPKRESLDSYEVKKASREYNQRLNRAKKRENELYDLWKNDIEKGIRKDSFASFLREKGFDISTDEPFSYGGILDIALLYYTPRENYFVN